MILFISLLIVIGTIIVIGIAGLITGGVAFLFTFGDVILCVLIIYWIVRRIFRKRG